jgi:septal ring factor EnvC (AmiA/AmiB activator)
MVWALLLLFWALAQPLPALEGELKKAQEAQRRTEARIQELNRALARLGQTTQALLRQVRDLEAEIGRLEKERADLQERIRLLQEEVRRAEKRIAQLEEDLKALKERLKALMVSLYRERAGRYLPLLRAESFTDLAVRSRLVGRLTARQQDTLKQLQTTLEALRQERTRLDLLLKDLAQEERAKAENQAALARKRQALLERLSELRKQEEGQKALLRESLSQRRALENQVAALQAKVLAERRRLEEERRRREEEERRARERAAQQAAQRATPPTVYVPPPPLPDAVGRLAFPIPGGRIVAAYGVEGPFQVLAGPAPGSPVQAAAEGYVAGILYVPNLGYTVMIAHTESLSTVYTNLQEPLVREGERVSKGQLIGYTGGGLLMRPEEIEFRVALLLEGRTRFVDPAAYY